MRRAPHLGQVKIILCIFLPLCFPYLKYSAVLILSWILISPWIWFKVETNFEYIFRICKNILSSVRGKGALFQRVFKFCFEYKLYWYLKGKETPILDRLVFNKVRHQFDWIPVSWWYRFSLLYGSCLYLVLPFLISLQIKSLLGGRINWLVGAGAPLSGETQNFIRVCLGTVIVQVWEKGISNYYRASLTYQNMEELASFILHSISRDMASLKVLLDSCFRRILILKPIL